MKISLLVLLFAFIGSSAFAEDDAAPAQSATQADWFSPSCSSCAKMLTPGTANLGNAKSVYRPGLKSKKKKDSTITTEPVNTSQ